MNKSTKNSSKSKKPLKEIKITEFSLNEEEAKNIAKNAFIKMDEKTEMPLYIISGTMQFKTKEASMLNYLGVIMHDKKQNKLKIKSRIRLENGTATKKDNSPEVTTEMKGLEEGKKLLKEMYEFLKTAPFLTEIEEIKELNFKIGETLENVIKEFNRSNIFDIEKINKTKNKTKNETQKTEINKRKKGKVQYLKI